MPAALTTVSCLPLSFLLGVTGVFLDKRRRIALAVTVTSAALLALIFLPQLRGAVVIITPVALLAILLTRYLKRRRGQRGIS